MYSHKFLNNLNIFKLLICLITPLSILHTVIFGINLVAALPVLTTLIADHNNVKDFKAFNIEDGWKSLRVLNLSFNKIADLGSLAAVPLLNELYLT
jgi:Leucine-rich repeat (LRR) protein